MGNYQTIGSKHYQEWKERVKGLHEKSPEYDMNDIYKIIKSKTMALNSLVIEMSERKTPISLNDYNKSHNEFVDILCYLWPILVVSESIKKFFDKYGVLCPDTDNKGYKKIRGKWEDFVNDIRLINYNVLILTSYYVVIYDKGILLNIAHIQYFDEKDPRKYFYIEQCKILKKENKIYEEQIVGFNQ